MKDMFGNHKSIIAPSCLVALTAVLCSCGVDRTREVIMPPEEWTLVWSDEFDAAEGTPVDSSKWLHDVGGHGWGNNQLEFNTDRTENVQHDGQGSLVITARKEDYGTNAYTSARIKTESKFDTKYGRVEARIRLPEGQGIWPAFWMLGANFTEVGWPECGEIDIMEFRGQETDTVQSSLHGPGYSGGSPISGVFKNKELSFADDFHVFAVDWDPSRFTFWVDDQIINVINSDVVRSRGTWVYSHPFFIILNVAIGGAYVGDPDDSTIFPQEMLVDYVRVFERSQK